MKNNARCRNCGDVIESKTRHDFVTCRCGAIAVDGGQDYMRRCGNPEDFMEVISLEKYNRICDKVIAEGLPVHETLIKLLEELGKYTINGAKKQKIQLKVCKGGRKAPKRYRK